MSMRPEVSVLVLFFWLNRSLLFPACQHSLLRSSVEEGSRGWGGTALMRPLCSVGKIDMVKSKWGLALAAVVTVLSSLLMSVGLCTLFGLTPTLNGG